MRGRKKLSDPPWELNDLEKQRIKKWYATGKKTKKSLGRMWAECRDYHESNGIQRASWEATFRQWIRNERTIEKGGRIGRARSQTPEPPSAQGPGRQMPKYDELLDDLTPVTSLLRTQREQRSRGSTTDRK